MNLITHIKEVNMERKVWIFVMLFLLQQNLGFSQQLNELSFNAKLNTITQEVDGIEQSKFQTLPDVLDNADVFKVDTLKSKGFSNCTFLRVKFLENIYQQWVSSETPLAELLQNKKQYYYSEFVLVYSHNREKFYRIKGYSVNDFGNF